jgi:hypothetical protein
MSKEFICTNSGNPVVINCASMKDVQKLKQVIFSEIKKSPIGIKLVGGDKTLFEKDIDFTGVIDFIKDTLIGIDTSEEFLDAIFECLKVCTYKKVYKIDMALFDNEAVPEARADYYEILYACIEENLRPFFQSLISTWKTHIKEGKLLQSLNIM